MKNIIVICNIFLLVYIALCSNVFGQSEKISVLKPGKVETPPRLDGDLGDNAWNTNPIIKEDFISYWTINGEILPQKTHAWAAYDEDNLYFAFYCFDTNPELIKTSVCRRDQIWEDDWIGLGLDAIGNKQGLYELFVNPNGIQGDRLHLSSTESWDESVDWVWYSSAQLVDDGYIVEIQVPLRSLRFKSGDNVAMGILFYRKISRANLEGSWPEVPAGQGYLNCTNPILFDNLNKQQMFEVLPSITSGSIWDRQSPEKWSSAETSNEIGISGKYGLTTSISLEGTYNPDFSQVESDAFQIQVNQRYPNFYTEKRPFFMESTNLFNVAGSGEDGNLVAAVHTRKIVDPQWGLKLTGEVDRFTFAFMGAGDEWPGRELQGEENPYLGKNANYGIGKLKYSLVGENSIGALFIGKQLGDSYNRVTGADFHFRFKKHHTLYGNGLYTFSNQPKTNGKFHGGAYNVTWTYDSKPLQAYLFNEYYGSNFNMETAYSRRTGITNIYYYFCPLWYPNPDNFPWMRRVRTFTWGFYTHDWVTGLDDYFTQIVINPFMVWNGWFRIDANLWGESWGGTTYHKKFFRFWSGNQITKWLHFYTIFRIGNSVFYDDVNHFMGDYINWRAELNLQPTENFNQFFSYLYETLENPETQRKQYDVHIFQSKTTYQFNEYFFIRGQVQYDSYREIVLTDFLASFTLIPGTVMHLGYGSLYEDLDWKDNQWLNDSIFGKYYQRSRSLFFKASYLYQL